MHVCVLRNDGIPVCGGKRYSKINIYSVMLVKITKFTSATQTFLSVPNSGFQPVYFQNYKQTRMSVL